MKQRKPIGSLLVTQFCGAFNDNAWSFVALLLMERALSNLASASTELQGQSMLVSLCLTVPLLLFSLPAASLADRVSKRTLILGVKFLELSLMVAGTVILFLRPEASPYILIVLAFLGLQSALFGPAKYGILPELVPRSALSAANGAVELVTFVAIIAGAALGPVLLVQAGSQPALAALVLVGVSVVGLVAAWRIPAVPAAAGEGEGWVTPVAAAVRAIRGDRTLWLAILGSAWFWGLCSLLRQDVLVYAKVELGLSAAGTGVPFGVFGVGVGLGAVLAGRLSAGKVETGLIPMGALGFAGFTLLLGAWSPGLAGTLVLMALLGVSAGFLIVPLQSLIQWRAPAARRGGVIAVGNVLVFGAVLAGSVGGWLLAQSGLSPRSILISAGCLTAAVTVWALWLVPAAFARLVVVLATRTFYKLKVTGREHLPEEGGVLLVANHVSFMDGFLLLASLDRPVRFIVDQKQYDDPLKKPLMKLGGAIPVSSEGGPREILRALRVAGQCLEDGEVVCIFPEGQITRTGALLPFRRGLEKIIKGRTAPIVPVHLDGLWGSIFSNEGGNFVWKRPREVPFPVTVSFGAPLPPTAQLSEVRTAVLDLDRQAWEERKPTRRPLHRVFISRVRRRPWALAMGDLTRPKVSRLGALTAAIALARVLKPHWKGQERVGILLPSSVAGALVNLAALLAGRTSVNLNFTAGAAGMGSAACQAGLTHVVTSRAFIEKAGLELPEGVEPLWLEDLGSEITGASRVVALLIAAFFPTSLIERACGTVRPLAMDDVATVIFSSGSTGEPKGIMLSHFNIDSNIEAVAQVFRLGGDDRLLGILPLFHSFGFMTCWFALNHGLPILFHPSPIDAPAIGKIVKENRVTVMLATPTFLQLYLRRCSPEQFATLRVVLVGAEKLSDALAATFEETMGVRPLEGYGATECSPVIAIGVPSHRSPGFYQPGWRRNFVGAPVPGVRVRIEDPETGEPTPIGEPGMLLVSGPNVMLGYLGQPEKTRDAVRDGWYVTGDIGLEDESGFLKITDRLSRFSKIGGEMVPHGGVEDALHEAAGLADEKAFAVTAMPDEKKGERLVVVTTVKADKVPAVLEKMGTLGLPNLFLPRKNSFIHVDAIPMLGTGKTDLGALKTMALEKFGSS